MYYIYLGIGTALASFLRKYASTRALNVSRIDSQNSTLFVLNCNPCMESLICTNDWIPVVATNLVIFLYFTLVPALHKLSCLQVQHKLISKYPRQFSAGTRQIWNFTRSSICSTDSQQRNKYCMTVNTVKM